MKTLDPDLRRSWLFGPGADAVVHEAMRACCADVLIVDLEDSTPAKRKEEARQILGNLVPRWREAGHMVAVRINALDGEGPTDLAAAMPDRKSVV